MHTVRMNITLPEDVAGRLKRIKNKSAFIAESLKEKFEHLEEEQLLSQLEAAYKAEALEADRDIEVWDGVVADGLEGEDDETWRDIHNKL